ncbi:hypothetical protein F4810DRAFT_519061 [Camillea tinctor]|nr:hypothetical protein F4810DRAFT_519061 [Camillea tinctor]
MSKQAFHAIVAGVGGGTGRSVACRFARNYPVVLLARRPESFNDVVAEIQKSGGKALGVVADITDPASVTSAFETIKKEMPGSRLAAAIYNVNSGFARKPFLELKREDLDTSLDGTVRGGFSFAQAALPLLLESVPDSPYPPSLIFTGATASIKASANFATFAAGKFALRALTQSLAREFGPKGVHIAHAIIDGFIDTPRVRELMKDVDALDEKMIKPDAIAESYWALHTQHRSALTQELDLRPFTETF